MTLQDLSDRLHLTLGYVTGALWRPGERSASEADDHEIADRVRQLIPYVQALLKVAASHPEEFYALMPTPIVHLLSEGAPFCGKPGKPGDWEPWHKWVPARDRGQRSQVNCGECLAKVEHLEEGN
jgi:hypothetical protein